MEIKSRVSKLIDIDWQQLNELQPDNVKNPYNFENTKNSILEYGFTVPFAVWKNEGKYYAVDGHLRKEVLRDIQASGVDVPNLLPAFEINAKNKKDAIRILIDCFNIRHNPFDKEALIEWKVEEKIEDHEINIEALNISYEEVANEVKENEKADYNDDSDAYHKHGAFPLAISLNKNEYTKWQAFKRMNQIRNDTEAFLKLLNDID